MSFPFVNDQPAEQNQAGATPASVTANPAPATDTATPPQTEFNASLQPGAYKIEWKGSPNFWSGRDGQTAIAICDHIMQGNMDSTNGWFKNRRSDASSHFGVGRDGRIWQWVRVEDSAWANGIMQGPDTSIDWIAECSRKNINPNTRTISIEHEGYTGNAFPEAQYQATLWLHRYLCTTYNIAVDRLHIIGHYQISSRDRAFCPGRAFPWQRLMNDLADLAGKAGAPAPTPAGGVVDDVPGIVVGSFGPGTVNTNHAYVRSRPSISSQDKTLVRTFQKGRVLHFVAYTDAGPAFRGGLRWYKIADEDGGGWIHSSMIS